MSRLASVVSTLVVISTFAVATNAQWQPANPTTGIYYPGNVGVGTSTEPADRLVVQGGALAFNNPSHPHPYVGLDYDTTSDSLRWRANIGAAALNTTWLVLMRQSGNVGIGTTNPADKLTIQGGALSFNSPSNPHPYVGFEYDAATDALRIRTNVNATSLNRTAISVDRQTSAVTIAQPGNVGTKLTVHGDVSVSGSITGARLLNAVFQDIAEWVPSPTASMLPGTVVVLSATAPNEVVPSKKPYDTAVAGVVSAQPGIVLGVEGSGKVQVATMGRVRVLADATAAPIRMGDLLATSNATGHAMRSMPISVGGTAIHRPGTILGKALEPLHDGRGEILILLSLQ